MIGSSIARIQNLVDKSSGLSIFLFFFISSLLIRFPFFFRDYIDRDESTFILVAQSLADGALPYTELWDLKPPLLFMIFAVPIALLGKSLVAIRLLGVLVVSGIAFATYLSGKQISTRSAGFMAGIFTVFLMSLFNSVQGLMSEHLSMLFFLPGIFLLIRYPTTKGYLLAGMAFGGALLCKSNLSVCLLILGLFLALDAIRRPGSKEILKLTALILSGSLVIVLTFIPYYLEGQAGIWWKSVVLAPLAYSSEQPAFSIKHLPFYLSSGIFLWLCWKKKWLHPLDRGRRIIMVCIVGILLTFLKGGRINGHYLLQFYPFILILLFAVFQSKKPSFLKVLVASTPFLLLTLPVESYMEYFSIIRNKNEYGTYFNGEGIRVPQYLEDTYSEVPQVFFLEYHIGYWFLGQNPPTKAATHPSNICRPELFPFIGEGRTTSMEELSYIMDTIAPKIVIRRDRKRDFDKVFVEENEYMRQYIKTHYRRDTLIGEAAVYTRL